MSTIDMELQTYLDLMYAPNDDDVSEGEAAPQARNNPMQILV